MNERKHGPEHVLQQKVIQLCDERDKAESKGHSDEALTLDMELSQLGYIPAILRLRTE